MNANYLVNIEKTKDSIDGYITLNNAIHQTKSEYISLDDIRFNPLTILGDIKYISERMQLYNDTDIVHLPYNKEMCFGTPFNITDPYSYFSLLDIIKEIMIHDKKMSLLDIHKLGNKFGIYLPYNFEISTQTDEANSNGFIIFELGTLEDAKQTDHLCIYPCDSISDIIFSIFSYLLMFNYHFFECKHCKKVSAIARKQGVPKYCKRTNKLSLKEYQNLTCTDTVEKLFDRIRASRKRIYNYLYLKDEYALDCFLSGYNNLYDSAKNNPSSENLLQLKNYVDTYLPRKTNKQHKVE